DRDGEGREARPDRDADLALERLGRDPRTACPRERERAGEARLRSVVAEEQQHRDRSEDSPRERAERDLFERAVEHEAQIVLGTPHATEQPRPAALRLYDDAGDLARRRNDARMRILEIVDLIREQPDERDRPERRDEHRTVVLARVAQRTAAD